MRKPRASGRTMIVDDGLPLAYARDLVALGGAYIDLAKIKTGTARLYPRAQLVQKLKLYKKNRIQPFLGGQFHEYVFATQGEKALPEVLRRIARARLRGDRDLRQHRAPHRRAAPQPDPRRGESRPHRLRRGRLEGNAQQPCAARRPGAAVLRRRRRAGARGSGGAGRAKASCAGKPSTCWSGRSTCRAS